MSLRLDLRSRLTMMLAMKTPSIIDGHLVFLSAFLLVPMPALQSAEPSPPAGFRVLFNGQDLGGWYGLNPHSTNRSENLSVVE